MKSVDDPLPMEIQLRPNDGSRSGYSSYGGMSVGCQDPTAGDQREEPEELRVPIMRRYGSGLGNLGNTCFMNCTLQCLAHTHPLRSYFLSGDYARDLNVDNPLGTGGDLTSQFATLLSDMWLTNRNNGNRQQQQNRYATRSSGYQYGFSSNSDDAESASHCVYPRNFKYTLGKHAEQFMGYDQHDSQEFATYLLDALHEDTNRITKKPYIEKPEQAEGESDEEAARKAWDLHLKREDSQVLDNFMAQLKSRVKCCKPECGRVSTTFDPIMFLSVPIPGSSDKSIDVTFIPLNPKERPKSLTITVNKLASIGDMLQNLCERVDAENMTGQGYSIAEEDLSVADVWKNEVHAWRCLTDDVGVIRDADETIIYELDALSRVKKMESAHSSNSVPDDEQLDIKPLKERARRYNLEPAELTRINTGTQWENELEMFVKSQYKFREIFNPHRATTEERVKYLNRLTRFVDMCYDDVESSATGQKRGREAVDEGRESSSITVTPDDAPHQAVMDRVDAQHDFIDVKSLYHVTVLAFLSKKARQAIIKLENMKTETYPEGVTIEVRMNHPHRGIKIAHPLVIRIPSFMTVYGLREELARRLERVLSSDRPAGQSPGERDPESVFGSQALLVLRQMPLTYQRNSQRRSVQFSNGDTLGSVERVDDLSFHGSKPVMASSTDPAEQERVAMLTGNEGIVSLDWPSALLEKYFNKEEYEAVEDIDSEEKTTTKKSIPTVLDCIEKFCQMEQLEETEMWYCSRCKEHVRAWKQFHLYRAPPILLVHLKRFHYSARSHRRDKISIHVDFPLKDLDLRNQVIHWEDGEEPIYDCYGVSNHYGGLGGGHYTAFALNDDREWCYYDDSRITTNKDPQEVVNDAAYVLYYRRKDVSTEPFVPSPQTSFKLAPSLIQVEKGRDELASEISSNAVTGEEDMDLASEGDSHPGPTDMGMDEDVLPRQ